MNYIVAPCKSGNCVVKERTCCRAGCCREASITKKKPRSKCVRLCLCFCSIWEGRGFLMVRQMSTKGPGNCSISSHLHSIILRLPASNKAREPRFLEAGHGNPRGPVSMPGWSLVEMCVSRDLHAVFTRLHAPCRRYKKLH